MRGVVAGDFFDCTLSIVMSDDASEFVASSSKELATVATYVFGKVDGANVDPGSLN